MKRIRFEVGLFRTAADAARSERVLRGLLFALAAANCSYLAANPRTPDLYTSGVQYLAEPPGQEDWQTIPFVWARGEGDCEDLATWRVAELRVRYGVRAMPRLTWRPRRNGRLYHITVLWPNGRVEDPSRVLGMGQADA